VPSRVLLKTRHRLENAHLYGGSVFEETLLDPIKTLRKDTLPRFLVSPIYKNMQRRLSTMIPLPKASDLDLPLPTKVLTAKWDDDKITNENLYQISMIDMLHDRLLYTKLLAHCKSTFTDENLLCARAVEVFKYHFTNEKCSEAGIDMAWLIFRFFGAPGSVFEVSLSHRRKKELMLNLANPKIDMFDRMQDSAIQMLRANWCSFARSAEFEGLPSQILVVKREMDQDENKRVRAPLRKTNSFVQFVNATSSGLMNRLLGK
jgi:hypothetical protein